MFSENLMLLFHPALSSEFELMSVPFNEGAVTTVLGREFHTSTTRFEYTLALTFSRERRLKIFKLLPVGMQV